MLGIDRPGIRNDRLVWKMASDGRVPPIVIEVLAFLGGTREHIRGLVLAKAPEELSDSWIEDLNNVKASDEQHYRLVEMKVLGRIRSLANGFNSIRMCLMRMIYGSP